MTPRPRSTSDEEILAATARVIGKLGPSKLTLAAVGDEAGVSPATLVQRFGSKRGLLLAFVTGADQGVEACFAEARAAHPSPLEALMAVAVQMADMAPTPEELSNHLAFLQIDLTDPDFHAHTLAHAKATRAGYRALIADAIEAGELRPCDPGELADAVGALAGGALLSWAIHREGDAATFLRRVLDTLLAPYRVGLKGSEGG